MKRKKNAGNILSGTTRLSAVERFNAINRAGVAKILKEAGKPNGRLVFYCTRDIE